MTDKAKSDTEAAPYQYMQNKTQITKVMTLCAVARPRNGWNGKIGIWPVIDEYVTKKWRQHRLVRQKPSSVNRPRHFQTRLVGNRRAAQNIRDSSRTRGRKAAGPPRSSWERAGGKRACRRSAAKERRESASAS
ncbi:TPA: hypothetical protein N0F65_000876 [Lagenidium giganteum]|uniref:Uncharacterized protein n=1 Tax=Lagenidium giganteum TaxID=4803 RepID=A0AAV2Z2S6_9STRA|nr:TPA: hypothetical protein N0F65_000876 [Lagenidium giganteum]